MAGSIVTKKAPIDDQQHWVDSNIVNVNMVDATLSNSTKGHQLGIRARRDQRFLFYIYRKSGIKEESNIKMTKMFFFSF